MAENENKNLTPEQNDAKTNLPPSVKHYNGSDAPDETGKPLKSKFSLEFTLSSLLENKKLLRVLSIVFAICIWVVVSTGAGATETKTIRGVPIAIDQNGNLYQSLGLKEVDMNIQAVDVQVTGPRYVISSISASDIVISADTGAVTDPGYYSLPLRAALSKPINQVVVHSLSTPVVAISFDTFDDKTYPLAIQASDVTIDTGYIGGTVTMSSNSVTVHGPSTSLAKIEKAVAKYYAPTSAPVSKGFVTTANITLLNKDNGTINDPNITISPEVVDVTVSVLKVKQMPVNLTLYNAPAGYASKFLSFSPSTIQVAGPADSIDKMTSLSVGNLDVSQITGSGTQTFSIVPPTGIIDLKNVGSIKVTINYAKVKSGAFNISNIQLNSQTTLPGYTVKILGKSVDNVMVYAATSDFYTLRSANLEAVISLDSTMVGTGQKMVPVQILSTKGKMVWAVGTYTVLIDIEPK